jgi:hypothetical protein
MQFCRITIHQNKFAMSKIPVDFDLQHQWGLFCDRCGVPEHKMPADQRREMKRAFFGACGQLLILLRDELGDYEVKHGEEAAAKILQRMLEQVGAFWQGEMDKQGRKN